MLDFEDWGERHLDAIVERAEPLLRQVRTGPTSAERINFCILKRVVERAAVELRRERDPAWARTSPTSSSGSATRASSPTATTS
ncbi:hypothetical protein [Nannocystis pusilla]|uniref:hypothetical protein n=1 Tax=Nannocystis pusilla TaxID=889268 RepID=UPI003B7E1F9C